MNKKTMKYLQGPLIYVLLLILVLWLVSMIGAPRMEEPEELSYSELLEWIEADLKVDEGLSDDTSKTISDVIGNLWSLGLTVGSQRRTVLHGCK